MFLMMMMTAAPTAAVAVPGPGAAVTAAYDALCTAPSGTPATVLALADRKGWQATGPAMPKDFDPATERFKSVAGLVLRLDAHEKRVRDERMESCGVSVAVEDPQIVGDVRAMFGFAPMLDMKTSATFMALRENGHWRNAAKLSTAEAIAAKAAGTLYSVIAASTDAHTALLSLQISPVAGE